MNNLKIYFPVILLCLVACVQLVLVENFKLSRWKGGGFGMYSESNFSSREILIEKIMLKNGTNLAFKANNFSEFLNLHFNLRKDFGIFPYEQVTFPTTQRLKEYLTPLSKKYLNQIELVKVHIISSFLDTSNLSLKRRVVKTMYIPF